MNIELVENGLHPGLLTKVEYLRNQNHNDELKLGQLKREINNIIWIYGDSNLTLAQAEELACEFFSKLTGIS